MHVLMDVMLESQGDIINAIANVAMELSELQIILSEISNRFDSCYPR